MSVSTVVIGAPCVGASTMFSILDVLASVGRDWEMLHGEQPGPPLFSASLLSWSGAPYVDVNGRTITPDGALRDAARPDLVIAPDLHLDPSEPLPEELSDVAKWIAAAHENGALAASVCSGALLLAESGLLDGREATTHWAFGDALATRRPAVTVRRERIIVPSGEGHRVVTAGGASAWADLMLYLIQRLAGEQHARRIAKVYLLEPHSEGQLCYASLVAGRQHQDRLISEAQIWVGENYRVANPVFEMARRSGLSERGFLRRFRQATGQTPAEYVRTLRVEEAKQLLETSEQPIEQIAEEVGYTEPSSLRAAFRKQVGVTASEYRRKWRGAFQVRPPEG